jgi:hypothetical protein
VIRFAFHAYQRKMRVTMECSDEVLRIYIRRNPREMLVKEPRKLAGTGFELFEDGARGEESTGE